METTEKIVNYLFNYTEQNPLIVDNYPYGFTLRTQIKYWIETVAKKGDRFCSQTLNPKNGRWNTPKKSTFSCIGIMFNDEKGHTHWTGISQYSEKNKVEKFIEEIGGAEKLNPLQLKMYNSLMGINEVKRDEFTDKIIKDYKVKWEKDRDGKYDEVKLTFDRPDGVKVIEIYKAMQELDQNKLNEVFAAGGGVRVCVRGGVQLGFAFEGPYREYLASDRNTVEQEREG